MAAISFKMNGKSYVTERDFIRACVEYVSLGTINGQLTTPSTVEKMLNFIEKNLPFEIASKQLQTWELRAFTKKTVELIKRREKYTNEIECLAIAQTIFERSNAFGTTHFPEYKEFLKLLEERLDSSRNLR